jgi:DeoR family fructose operon transcriptional repressor
MIMFAQERLNVIKKIVRQRRRINFSDLQNLIKVSPATLRRDLAEMEQSGDIIRVHGGVLDPGYVRSEISFDERLLRNSAGKKAIALAAAALVPQGASVLVDAGSTCLEAGKVLLGRKDVRIITHSVALVQAGFHGAAAVLCLGGELRKVSGALTGAATLGALTEIKADIAFVGASGLDPAEGCSTTELSEASMKQALLARASRKVLLADHSKWGQPSTVRFAQWKEIDEWVTDGKLPVKDTKHLLAAGVRLRVA